MAAAYMGAVWGHSVLQNSHALCGEVAEHPLKPTFPASEARAGFVTVSRSSCAPAVTLVNGRGNLSIRFSVGNVKP